MHFGALVFVGTLFVAAATPGPGWLDAATPKNWNGGSAIPSAPKRPPSADLNPRGRCGAQIRLAQTPEDAAVNKAGWTLWGPYQRFDATSVVLGMQSVDGMCRPMEYQAFVFVNARFAGTIAPHAMDARTDGSFEIVRLFAANEISADFARYHASDPLCCPYATTTVDYQLRPVNGRALVAPTDTFTNANAARS